MQLKPSGAVVQPGVTLAGVRAVIKVDAHVAGIIIGATLVLRGTGWKSVAKLPQWVCLKERTITEAVVRTVLTLSDTAVAARSEAVRLSRSRATGNLTYTALQIGLRLQHVIGGAAGAAVLARARTQLIALIGQTAAFHAARVAEAAESAVGAV